MSNQPDESEELKSLTTYQLPSVVWNLRVPKEKAFFQDPLVLHIRTKFNEFASNDCGQQVQEFTNLRNIAINGLAENAIRDHSTLKNLKKYYCQLLSMLARFKGCEATFPWRDAYSKSVNEGDLEFELNNIMYNIASIHNELGAKISTNTEQSAKEACTQFTNALWWVTELRDNRTGLKPKEMGHDMLTFYHHILRGQGQENVLLHSLRASMKAETVAKITAQIANDYEVASKLAHTPLYTDPLREMMMGSYLLHNWRQTTTFKQRYYAAMTQLLTALGSRDDQPKEIGIRIARLQFATQILEESKKFITDSLDSDSTKEAYEKLNSIVSKKLDKALRYNNNVYHSSIPGRETLGHIEGMLLIKPSPFTITSMPEFRDIFSNIVSIESIQVNSIYSQRKDDLSRTIRSQVLKQDEELAHMMSTLNIDKKNLKLPALAAPDELVEICAELSMSPNIVDEVLTKLEELDDKSEEIQTKLEKIEQMLRQRPNREFEAELKRYKSAHQEVLVTIQSLHKQLYPDLQQMIQRMALTSNPIELLPKIDDQSPETAEVVRKLEKLVDKVEEMKQQRCQLMTQLKGSLDDDDVIKHVVAASSEYELKSVFDSEIKKHNKYLEPLQANLKAQNEILDTIERLNAQFGQIKIDHKAKQAAYKEKVESLKKFYVQFKTTSDGIEQGLTYHVKMLDLVNKFYQKVQASCDLHDLLN